MTTGDARESPRGAFAGGAAPRPRWSGPVAGMVAQMVLLAALAATTGLTGAGWAVGIACAVAVNTGVAWLIVRDGCERLSAATWVTLARAALAVGVAALVAQRVTRGGSVVVLVALAAVALVLDLVDGWLARRTDSVSVLGGRLDGEIDAFLMLVLSVGVAHLAGAWVLAIGMMRYAFLVAGWVLPWMRARLPFRYWRKVVTATQGIVLTAAVADVLPLPLTRVVVALALALLAESFGRDVWWLWRHRGITDTPADMHAPPPLGAAVTLTALGLVWFVLVAPNRVGDFDLHHFLRLPVEGLLAVGVALALPTVPRRILAAVAGVAAGALLIVRLLDLGFYELFDRPFNPVDDWTYAGAGMQTLRASVGSWQADLAVAVGALLIAAVMVLTPLSLVRLSGRAARHRGPALRVLAVLGAVCLLTEFTGPRVVSTRAAYAAVDEVHAVRSGLAGRAEFARELRVDEFGSTPAARLLTGLRGKDVLLVFVESYGRVAVQDSWFSPGVDAVLARGDAQLRAAGFSARSAFLRSSTFGGFSWLAHGSVQAGVWVDSKRRYDQLVTGNRLTLATAFKRAGWRTLAIDPANDRAWPEGSTFYHLDAVYDRRNVGYRGPRYAFAPMPDQYVLTALQRLELSRRPRRNIFAEVDLISSHEPWTRIPRLVPWNRVGDGAVFNDQPSVPTRSSGGFGDATGVQRDYGHSIEYSLRTLFSFVRRAHDPNLVLVVLGDHQPNAVVTGENPSTHDVPISVIAHDPAVLARIRGWRWRAGTRPDPTAPVWPMDAFRDRFLRAFGPAPARRITPRTGAAGPACARPCAPSSPGSGRSPANGARRSAPAG
ncbi:MAG: CDP-alcohol phosphatidyltransferase family protein [Thermoleophilia bacterium]